MATVNSCNPINVKLLINDIIVYEDNIECGCVDNNKYLSDYRHIDLSKFLHEELEEFLHGK